MIFKRHPDVVRREIAGEVFLIPIKNKLADMQNVFVLHGAGDFIWERLDGSNDAEHIAALMVEEYDVGEKTAVSDVSELVGELEKAGLVIP